MAVSEFSAALKQVAVERGIPEESILETIRVAIASAYRKDYGTDVDSVEVILNPETGETRIFNEAKKDVTPPGFGRIAAQTAKQVILQKIRETEKEVILDEYKGKVGQIVLGTIFRVENGVVVLDLGRAQGVLPQSEQVDNDDYRSGQKLKVLVKDIRENSRGTEIIVSRADSKFLTRLFEQEVPEIASGVVTIEAIAREAGSRTKMAVLSTDDKIDPVGSCVGQKGVRVQAIISEIHGEKIDIVPFSTSIDKFIAASLSPAKVTEVEINTEAKEAKVSVPEDQLSLAIGKDGQNVRLAAKLTRWRIDIKGATGVFASDGAGFATSGRSEEAVVGVWDAAIKAAKKMEDEAKQVKIDAENEEKTEEAPEVTTVESTDSQVN
ncbi:transcription termination/antitermination protein NusA [candidate division WWE3 bacterium]|nr:transcription termination/antitermination protein NusA [candidate division WWE3 bacterium]